MNKHKIVIDDDMNKLPSFYWIPKMHKTPPKQRYIAASNKCTTKALSTIITKCLKLITLQHRKLCKQIYNRTGVNRMWIVDNSRSILERIADYNSNGNIKNVSSYDFSTLYTNIPHKDLKIKMKWIVEKAFYRSNQVIYVSDYGASWSKRRNTHVVDKETLIEYIYYLIDNIYINVGDHVFRQAIGIPMGTDCAPFLANLYLYALEYDYLEKLTKQDIYLARKFSNSYRYIDDLISFNNNNIINHLKNKIYPSELVLNKENEHNHHCTFLDIDITINDNKIHTTLYDKRDDFDFDINNFPNLSGNIHNKRSHNIVISQFIRYSKVCLSGDDFISISKILIRKLLLQFFDERLLKKKCSYFYDKYHHLINHYNYTKPYIISSIFE